MATCSSKDCAASQHVTTWFNCALTMEYIAAQTTIFRLRAATMMLAPTVRPVSCESAVFGCSSSEHLTSTSRSRHDVLGSPVYY